MPSQHESAPIVWGIFRELPVRIGAFDHVLRSRMFERFVHMPTAQAMRKRPTLANQFLANPFLDLVSVMVGPKISPARVSHNNLRAQTRTFEGSGASNTKILREDTEREKSENCGGRGKKSEILGGPAELGVRRRVGTCGGGIWPNLGRTRENLKHTPPTRPTSHLTQHTSHNTRQHNTTHKNRSGFNTCQQV